MCSPSADASSTKSSGQTFRRVARRERPESLADLGFARDGTVEGEERFPRFQIPDDYDESCR